MKLQTIYQAALVKSLFYSASALEHWRPPWKKEKGVISDKAKYPVWWILNDERL